MASTGVTTPARYDNYRLWRVFIETPEQLEVLKDLEKRGFGIDFIGHVRTTDQKLTILVPAHLVPMLESLFHRYSITNTVLLPNIQDNIDRQRLNVKPKETRGADLEWNNYYQLDTLMDYLDHLIGKYEFVTGFEIGKTFEGRAIRGVKIAKGGPAGKRPGVFIEGTIHAREWISPATVTYLINQLLTSPNPDVQALADDFDWYFVPVLNCDGYAYTFDVDRLWRKNRKPYGLCVGVDLNRNFDCNWNGSGSSGDPAQFDFAGSGPNSEPEVAALASFLTENKDKIQVFISLHSFSQLIMFPYGHTEQRVENYEDLKAIGEEGRKAIKARHGKDFGVGSIIETIYPSSGGSSDWVAHALGIKISYTIELRGAPDDVDMFILPAEQITPVGEEMTDAFVAMFQEAKRRGCFN